MTKIGRNDPCPCGSGKKYKSCCLNGKMECQCCGKMVSILQIRPIIGLRLRNKQAVACVDCISTPESVHEMLFKKELEKYSEKIIDK